MRESADNRPAIDLSEFERRLRSGDAAKKDADPFTELARLMHGEEEARPADRFDQILAPAPSTPVAQPGPEPRDWRAATPAPAVDPAEWMRHAFDAAPGGRRAPDSQRREPAPPDFSDWRAPTPAERDAHAFEADFRGSLDAPATAPRLDADFNLRAHNDPRAYDPQPAAHEPYPEHDSYPDDAYPQYADAAYYADAGHQPHGAVDDGRWAQEDDGAHHWREGDGVLDYGDADGGSETAPEPRGGLLSRLRPWHAVAGVAVVAVASIGWVFAHRSGALGTRELATIAAPEGPVKVHPSTETDSQGGGVGATVLDRNESAPVKKVVTHEEQPVEPQLAPKFSDAQRLGDDGRAPAPEARRVKTVSVRPDGTVVETGDAPSAVMKAAETPPPGKPPQAAAAKGQTPKPGAKPATTPRADKAAAKPKEPAKPKIAEAQPDADAPEADADAKPAKPAAKMSAGGYAAQFGAAQSEAEARVLMNKIAGQFGSQLGGHRPTFKMAEVNGKTVYRVRVSGVSKEAAAALCEKVRAGGGNCFVAGSN